MAIAGLALAEAHKVLSEIQHHLVTAQADTRRRRAALRELRPGQRPQGHPAHRAAHPVRHAAAGKPPVQGVPVHVGGPATVSPVAALLPERTTPELLLWRPGTRR